MTLDEQEDWDKYFKKRKDLISNLKTSIFELDEKVNSIVYQMYGMTDDEIRSIEKSIKIMRNPA